MHSALCFRSAPLWLLLLLVICGPSGCSPSAPETGPGTGKQTPSAGPVRLLVLDDPELAAVIEREWKARAEGELKVEATTWEKVQGQPQLSADAIVYPLGLIGTLAEAGKIVPLPKDATAAEGLAWNDVLELSRRVETQWGGRTYGVPLGSAQFTLLYRADLLSKLGVEPPATWAEYQVTTEKLRDATAFADAPLKPGEKWSAVAEPLGSGSAGLVLLARAASYAKPAGNFSMTFHFITMQPLIDGPPYVKALEELVAAAKLGPSNTLELTPDAARRKLLAGECALALTWPARERDASTPAPAAGLIAAAELPGSAQVYDATEKKWLDRTAEHRRQVPLVAVAGRLGSVTSAAKDSHAALNVLLLLASREWSTILGPAGAATGVVRRTQLEELGPWLPAGADAGLAKSYRDAVSTRNQAGIYFLPPRLPGRERYLTALDEAVRRAVRGEAKPADALAAAAEQWRAITAELGLESQKEAYRRCLGIE